METIETNLVFSDKNIKRAKAKSVEETSYTLNVDMKNEDKLKIIKEWYQDYENTKTFNLFLVYNGKTYNLYSFSLKGGDIKLYFTYSDESKTYGFGMEVININNEFPTFISDNPEFDISTLTKQESTGGSRTSNYDELENKPSINGTILEGNLTSEDLGISEIPTFVMSGNINSYIGDTETKNIFRKIIDYVKEDKKFKCYYIYHNTTSHSYPMEMVSYEYHSGYSTLKLYFTYFQQVSGDTFIQGLYMYCNNIDSSNLSIRVETASQPALKRNVLSKDNISTFTPTGDYNPATKKYVDDSIANISSGRSSDIYVGYVNNENITVDIIKPILQEAFNSGASTILLRPSATAQYSFCLISSGRNLQLIENIKQILFTDFDDFKFNVDGPALPTRRLLVGYSISEDGEITVNSCSWNYLNGFNNNNKGQGKILVAGCTKSFTPTLDYDPATKKYVDQQVGNIQTLLEEI